MLRPDHLTAISLATQAIMEFEGFVPHPYLDGAGTATIGYGTTRYPDGRPVRMADPSVTTSVAESYLLHDLWDILATLCRTIPAWDTMQPHQQAALLSFAYNLGEFFYGKPGFATISAALREHRWADVPAALTLYANPNNPAIHRGLLRRRQAEGALWRT